MHQPDVHAQNNAEQRANQEQQRTQWENVWVNQPEAHAQINAQQSAQRQIQRENTRLNQPEAHAQNLAQRRLNYRYMPLQEYADLLDNRRVAYESMNQEERDALLQHRRQRYANMSQVERLIYLDAAQTYQGQRRTTYTQEKMQHELDANSRRMQEIRDRRHTRRESANTPIGCRCNMDNHNIRRVRYHNVGGLDLQCVYCDALGFKGENKGTSARPHFGERCCRTGKIQLTAYPDLPPYLLQLFTDNNQEAWCFRDHVCFFNSGMALASCVVNDATVREYGPASFKVCGIMHRRLGPMLQQAGSTIPNCMQTYFHDADFKQCTEPQEKGQRRIWV